MKTKLTNLLSLAVLSVAPLAQAQITDGRSITIAIRGVETTEQGKIDGKYFVSSRGTIHMPYLSNDIYVRGLSPSEAASKIESAYKQAEIYTTAVFQVETRGTDGFGEDTIIVAGEVRAPGEKPFKPGMTLFAAIATSGGEADFANKKKVILIRKGQSKVYDLTNTQDRLVRLEPDDMIEVKESSWVPSFGIR